MEGLEVDPHRRGRIGEPAGSERFPREQKAEFIVDRRLGDRRNRQAPAGSTERRGPPGERPAPAFSPGFPPTVRLVRKTSGRIRVTRTLVADRVWRWRHPG